MMSVLPLEWSRCTQYHHDIDRPNHIITLDICIVMYLVQSSCFRDPSTRVIDPIGRHAMLYCLYWCFYSTWKNTTTPEIPQGRWTDMTVILFAMLFIVHITVDTVPLDKQPISTLIVYTSTKWDPIWRHITGDYRFKWFCYCLIDAWLTPVYFLFHNTRDSKHIISGIPKPCSNFDNCVRKCNAALLSWLTKTTAISFQDIPHVPWN